MFWWTEVLKLAARALLAALLPAAALAAPYTASVDPQSGLVRVTRGGAEVLSTNFAFWGKNWAWAHQETSFKIVAPYEYAVTGRNRLLGYELAGRARKASDHQLVWEFDLDAKASSEAVGGGISFKFDVAAAGADLGEPVLLPDNRGWSWGRPGGSRLEFRVDPPLASVQLERGGGPKREIRANLYKGTVTQGKRRHVATLSLAGGAVVAPTDAERFGLDDHLAWPTDIASADASPVDLSFLNAQEKPAGKHGFLGARGNELVFADGTVARFWGTNLTAHALFGTSRDAVKLHARRLSRLGFNLVRMVHHDSDWVDPNIFGGKLSRAAHDLDPAMLEKIDWWISCLKAEGIYVWLDLHVGRTLAASDRIDYFDEISAGRPVAELTGFSYVNPSIQRAMKRFNDAYVSHVNPYTGASYKEDPAIVAMLITNENDVTHHYGNSLLPDKNVPKHNALYMAQAKAFATRHRLPADRTWRSWEPGPAKLFLNDLEQRFAADMTAHLRAAGVKVPIVTTSSWGDSPLSSLPALASGSIVDVHSYGGVGELEKNPLYAANLVHRISAAHVAGRPLSVSEWNAEQFPAADRHTLPLYVAASARLQGWDALMLYAYAQVPLQNAGYPANWHAYNDPGLLASLPAAALLYRRGDVREANTVYAFAPSKETLFYKAVSAENSVALRTAAERGKLVVVLPQVSELPWLAASAVPSGATLFSDPGRSFVTGDTPEMTSDTGELRRNWEQGTYTIDSPRTQAATGWIGGRKVRLADVDIAVVTRSATVAVQSMDGNPIGTSRALMISLGARSTPRAPDRLPFYSEQVVGSISIRAPKGLRLYKQGNGAADGRSLPAAYQEGRYHIELDQNLGTYWLVLR